MSRWIYISAPLLSAAVLGAVLFVKPAPQPMRIGVLDSDLLFRGQPDYKTLQEVKAASKRNSPPADGGTALSDDAFKLDVLNSEWNIFNNAISLRNTRLSSLISRNSIEQLKRDYLVLYGEREEKDKREFEDMERQLKDIYERINSTQAEADDLLKDEKFSLMNLRMKLKVLTHDPFVFPDNKVVEIQNEINSIEKIMARAETERAESRREELDRKTGEVRNRYVLNSEKSEKELERQANELLKNAEKHMSETLRGFRSDMERRLEESRIARTRIPVREEALGAHPVVGPDSLIFDEIETELKKEFDRRLRRKAFAVAERRRLFLIVDTPYPAIEAPTASVEVGSDFSTR